KEAPEVYPLSWKTPWGRGFPGWHIECSVMSMKYLGEQIDIHGGGQDLIFPHHENEIAQSEAITGKKPFVKYWLHTGELTVGGKGMHKSFGNFLTIRDVLKNYSRDVVRFFILSAHYRTPLDYSEKAMEQASENASRIKNLLDDLHILEETAETGKGSAEFKSRVDIYMDDFVGFMSNDFNTSNAIASLHEFVRFVNSSIEKQGLARDDVVYAKGSLYKMLGILGLFQDSLEQVKGLEPTQLLKLLLDVRRELRKRGLYDLGDKIRSELAERGVIIEDLKEGERVRIVR
ncbi:MAG: DALR domain-containing protein, partial [Candidatus Caldarchaeum sp.]